MFVSNQSKRGWGLLMLVGAVLLWGWLFPSVGYAAPDHLNVNADTQQQIIQFNDHHPTIKLKVIVVPHVIASHVNGYANTLYHQKIGTSTGLLLLVVNQPANYQLVVGSKLNQSLNRPELTTHIFDDITLNALQDHNYNQFVQNVVSKLDTTLVVSKVPKSQISKAQKKLIKRQQKFQQRKPMMLQFEALIGVLLIIGVLCWFIIRHLKRK